jgi:hypothetical protein
MIKPLVGTFALLTVLMVAAPALAQSPTVPSSPDDPTSKSLGWVEPAPESQARSPTVVPVFDPAEANAAMPRQIRHRTRSERQLQRAYTRTRGGSRTDHIANQLNRQELGRLQSASGTSPPQRAPYPSRGYPQ